MVTQGTVNRVPVVNSTAVKLGHMTVSSNQTKMARFSKLKQRLLLVKSLQDSGKQRNERQQKILFTLARKANTINIASIFPDYTPAFFRELPLLFDHVEVCHNTITDDLSILNTYSDARFKKTFRVSVLFLTKLNTICSTTLSQKIQFQQQLGWQCAFTAFLCFQRVLFRPALPR